MNAPHPPTAPAPALIIAGMHRSGTSLTAALCQSAGLFIGHSLMPGYAGNERGHFEDLDFVGLHERSLASAGLANTGFEVGSGPPAVPDAERQVAASLVAERRGLGVPWGWKDPRGTLFLPFWAAEIPEARFLLVFRRPWEVVDSLFRRNGDVDQVLRRAPLTSARLWCHYNTLMRDFARSQPDRVLVREIRQIVADPAAFVTDIGLTMGAPLVQPQPLYDPKDLRTDLSAVRECLVSMAVPECRALYAELCGLAGGWQPPEGLPDGSAANAACERAFTEWAEEVAPTRQAGEPHSRGTPSG